MRWLLDTNAVIFALRNRPAKVRARLDATSPDDVFVSSVTVAELWYGAEKGTEPEQRRALFDAFIEPYSLLTFDRPAAERHGILRHQLRHDPIGERDLLIAAIALANDLTVVTESTREFGRVAGLDVEDWGE